MIWYDMIWYDMIWYDMIWYDMIWYDIYDTIYLLTAIGLTPGVSSSTVHIYTQTIHRTTQLMILSHFDPHKKPIQGSHYLYTLNKFSNFHVAGFQKAYISPQVSLLPQLIYNTRALEPPTFNCPNNRNGVRKLTSSSVGRTWILYCRLTFVSLESKYFFEHFEIRVFIIYIPPLMYKRTRFIKVQNKGQHINSDGKFYLFWT